MFRKGHVKEIFVAGGTLTIVSSFNPMDLVDEERRLVFEIVDLIRVFETDRYLREQDPEVL